MATGDILILGTFHANTQDEVLVRAPQVQGTYIVVPDTTAMNAITNEVAIDGTLVYVVNAGTTTEGVTYGNTYRKVNGAWAEELMPLQVQNVLSERINDLNDDVDDLKKDIEDLAKQDETILIGLTEITNIKNDITVFKTNVTNKFIDIDNTFVNINIDIDEKFGAVNEDIDRIEGALSGYERVLNLQNAKHNEDGTVVHNGSVTSEGFTYNYTDEETNEDHEVFIEPPTVYGYGSMMIGGYRYDAGELIGTESEDKHKSFSYGNQTFGAGGGVQLWGDWDVGFGKNTTAYQKATFVMGGGSVAGMTKEEFVERWREHEYNAAVDKTVDGWEDLIVDHWGSTYDKSYSFATSIGEICLAKGRGAFSFGSHAEAWGTYALAGGYKAIVKTKDYGLALGYEVETLGEHGINIGHATTLKGTYAINIGSNNNNSSLSEDISPAGYVTMIGNNLTTVRPYQIALGRYNLTHRGVTSVFQVADGTSSAPYDVIGVYKTNPDTGAATESLYGNAAKYTVEIKGNVNVTKGQGAGKGHGGNFTADYIKCWSSTETNGVKFPKTINGITAVSLTMTAAGISSTSHNAGNFDIVIDSKGNSNLTRNIVLVNNSTSGICDESIVIGNEVTTLGTTANSLIIGKNVISNALTNSLIIGNTIATTTKNVVMIGDNLTLNSVNNCVAIGRYNMNICPSPTFLVTSIFEIGDGPGSGTVSRYNPFSIYKSCTYDAKTDVISPQYGNAASYVAEFKSNVNITQGQGKDGNGNPLGLGGTLTAVRIKCNSAPKDSNDVLRLGDCGWTEFYWYQNDFEVTTADKSKVTVVPTQPVSSGNPALRVFVNRKLRLMSITGRLQVTVSAKLSTRLTVDVKYDSIKNAIGEKGVTDPNSGFRNMTAQMPISVTYSSSSGVKIVPQGGYINMYKTALSFMLFETFAEPREAGTYLFNVNATFFY
jgi:hypothetical protein